MKPLLGLVALLLTGAARPPALPPVEPAYILAGQSNMSGRGDLSALTPDERAADPRILVYGNDAQWRDAMEPLDDAAGQVDAVSADLQAGVGPGLFFARAMLAEMRRPLVLLPCAKGGSSIARWSPTSGRNTLYGSCLASKAELQRPVAGLLWYQGESDTDTADRANAWPQRFRDLVARLRADLENPKLPVVFVQLSDKPERNAERFPYWRRLQQLQAGFTMPCVAMVKAAGLAKNPDGLHLATEGQRELGRRMAAAMLRLQKKGCR